MPLLTQAEAIDASRARYGRVMLSEAALANAAQTPLSTRFDIFLSHASEDAAVIAGVREMIRAEGLTVYVDWVDDPQADRSRVSTATAQLLRTRMNNSNYLLYTSSRSSSDSKWMPWELGYFDGHRPGRIGVLPVVPTTSSTFVGIEFLGLYPIVERLDFSGTGVRFGRRTAPERGRTLRQLASS